MNDESIAQQAFPTVYVTSSGTQNGVGQLDITPTRWGAPDRLLVLTVDLVDFSLVNGDQAKVLTIIGGTGSNAVAFHQGATYTSSQGYFPWRGAMLVVPPNRIELEVFQGDWNVTLTGILIPAYAAP